MGAYIYIYICIIYILYIIYYIHIIYIIYIYIAKVWWTMPITRWHFGPGGMDYGSSPSHWNPGFKQPEFDRMGFVVFFVAGKMLQISYQWDFQTTHTHTQNPQLHKFCGSILTMDWRCVDEFSSSMIGSSKKKQTHLSVIRRDRLW